MEAAEIYEPSDERSPGKVGAANAAQSGYMSFVPVHHHPAQGAHGVLMISPWGIEELCARKAYRCLAERLSGRGYPVLRFDLPGTADARAYSASETWLASANEVLKRFADGNGLASVTVLAQGAGALIAARLAAEHPLVKGCILLAPVSSGRHHLRELLAWSNLMKESYRDETVKAADGALRAAGFVLSAEMQEELKSLSTGRELAAATCPVLLLQRPNHPGDAKLAEEISQSALDLTCFDFDEYSGYVGDPTLSQRPGRALDAVERWLEEKFPPGMGPASQGGEAASAVAASLPLGESETAITEEMLRFGDDRTCFGVLTAPSIPRSGTGFIFLNSGYDHHIGWGRCHVEFARSLAREGHVSLRIDASGIGEAGLHAGQDAQILYSDSQIADVTAAVDVLERRGIGRIILVGRCSGAYLAFLATVAEPRVSAVVLVNTRRFAWDPRQVVDTEIRKPVQPLENYQRKLRDRNAIRRALSSTQNFRQAATKLDRGIYRPLKRAAERRVGRLSVSGRLIRLVHERMRTITGRGGRVLVVFGEDDMGREELEFYFGPAGQNLDRFPGARVEFMTNTDHNVTSEASRRTVLSKLRQLASEV